MKDDTLQEHQIKKDVSNKVFGYQLASIFLIIIFVRFILFTKLNFIDLILFFISLILFTISKFKEEYVTPIKKIWLRLSVYIAKILNPIILLIVYVLCFVPIGIIYKLIKKKNLKTKINNTNKTYWEKPEENEINFKDQF